MDNGNKTKEKGMRMTEKKRNKNGLGRKLRTRIVLAAVCAAGFVLSPFGVIPAEAETEQNTQPARMDMAGMALWEAAQERQRELSQTEARLEGTWSLEYGGFRISQPFTGQAELTGLGTEELEGFLSIASSKETVFRFQNGQATREDASGETVLLSDPASWLALSNGFMNGTTYDLSLVKELWVSGHEEDREDKSTVLSYRLEENGAAKQIQPMVRNWLAGMGLSLPEEGDWLELHQVEGELTVSSAGYMAVDRLRAEATILMGQESAKGVFEICVTYPGAGG